MDTTRAAYLALVVEPNEDGYLASCPGIQGAFAEGDTIEEAIFNCVDVVKVIAGYRAERPVLPTGSRLARSLGS